MSVRARPLVAIDGPAGSGKSTVARLVAQQLGFLYVDTGAMYRAIALKADRLHALDDPERLVEIARAAEVSLQDDGTGNLRVTLDGEDVSAAIRTPRVSAIVSAVSAIPGVRKRMVELQRALGANGGIVMEGRDIQTVVFPDAEVKIFLTASTEERSRRRWRELQVRSVRQSLEEVERALRDRDEQDSTRVTAPLAAAVNAVTVVTDGLTIDEVVARIAKLVRESTSPAEPNNACTGAHDEIN